MKCRVSMYGFHCGYLVQACGRELADTCHLIFVAIKMRNNTVPKG